MFTGYSAAWLYWALRRHGGYLHSYDRDDMRFTSRCVWCKWQTYNYRQSTMTSRTVERSVTADSLGGHLGYQAQKRERFATDRK